MADLTNELMFELLKRIQADSSGLKDSFRDLRLDLSNLRTQVHLMQGDMNHMRGSIARIDDRLDRIENRLDLRELSEAQSRFEPHP